MHLLCNGLAEEAEVIEMLRSQPHLNIIGYYGCHIRRRYITRLILDQHLYNLNSFLKSGQTILNKDLFIESLHSAIYHLHTLSWAYNNINPLNVLVAEDGRPILIDFGSSRRIREKLSTSHSMKGWINSEIKDYTTLKTHYNTFALNKIYT